MFLDSVSSHSCLATLSCWIYKMPRTKTSGAAASKAENTVTADEPDKSIDVEEKVDLDEAEDPEEDPEELMEEEVEYEEVEEEVEVDDDEEEEEVEEVEEEDEDNDASEGQDEDTVMEGISKDEKEKRAQLLALPPHGSEVFIGGIPTKATEEELRDFCERVGEVVEVRVMKGKTATENKGYAFVMFKTKELASEAMKRLNNTNLKGKKIKCSSSQAKQKLFIGNIPRTWSEEDLRKVVTVGGPGVTAVELLKDPQHSSRNRGFAFIEYYNHACAEYSRQKMSDSNFKLNGNSPMVSWADPKNTNASVNANVESIASSQGKALYVKNLPKDVTADKLKEVFGLHGQIAKVVLPPAKLGHENSRYGFVHYVDRSSTMKAIKHTEKYEVDGHVLECSLAKPQTDQKAGISNSQKSNFLPSYPSHAGYGLTSVYPTLGSGYAASGLPQPLVYGMPGMGGPPPGTTMMPMLLPDGRIGYVLQQQGMQMHTPLQPRGGRGFGGGSSRGGSSSGGKRGGDNNRGRSRYNPY